MLALGLPPRLRLSRSYTLVLLTVPLGGFYLLSSDLEQMIACPEPLEPLIAHAA